MPLYGCGLCILYLLASIGGSTGIENAPLGRALLFLGMAAAMTGIEYIVGIWLLKCMKLRLWDYSKLWGNIQGLICPLFSLFWAALGAVYYFLIHPYVLDALAWLAANLAFSFVIGFFFGVFTIDVSYSAHLISRLKRYADEKQVVIRYENLKSHIQSAHERLRIKPRFFIPLHTELSLSEFLNEAHETVVRIKKR